MFLAWVCFGILISNIILSHQLSPAAITTSTKCAIENQKIQGFTASQFFQCVRKENKLYFEARYCPSVKNTFYETEQRCLPNIGGGEVRCLIPGKRCSHNILGPMAYPNKFKANYYIVCLPKATHICKCYGNAIYDESKQMCRVIPTTTDMGRDDSNGIIPKIICEKSGIHSTVELESPDKQKCVLFCYQKYPDKQFELNIICANKTNLTDASVPIINPLDTNGEKNIPPEIQELIAQEFLKSTNSYDNLGWLLEKSTTENSQDEEKRKPSDITSTPIEKPILGSSSTTDQNIKEKPIEPSSFKYDENTSEQIYLTSLPIKDGSWPYDTSHTFNERATTTQLSGFSSTESEPDIQTTEKITAQDADQVILSSIITEDGSMQTTIDNNFNERTSSPLIFITEEETTYSPRKIITSVSYTIGDEESTKRTTNLNTIETSSNSQLLTTEDIIKSSSEKPSLGSLIPQHEQTQWPIGQNSIVTTLSSIVENKTTNPFSENLLLANVTAESESMPSTLYQNFKESKSNTLKDTNSGTIILIAEDETINHSIENLLLTNVTSEEESILSTTYRNFKETSSTPITPTDVHNPNEINFDTIFLITEDKTTNQSNEDLLLSSVTPEGESLLATTYRNIKETSTTTILPTDIHNQKETNSDTIFLITEHETTNQFTENLLLTSVTSEGESLLVTTFQNFKETSSTTISTTDVHNQEETNSDTILLITKDKTANQSNEDLLLSSVTPEGESLLTTTYQNIKKTSTTTILPIDVDNSEETISDTILLITKDETTNQFNENLLLTSVTSEGESILSTTLRNFKETSRIPILPTDDYNRNETNSDTILLITDDKTTNQSIENLLLTNVTSEGESILSTTYRNIKESSSTLITPTDDYNPEETNTDTMLLITEDETTNQYTKKLLLTRVTAEGESILPTTDRNIKKTTSTSISPTDVHNLEKTKSDTLLLITEDETTNQSKENVLLTSATFEGESILSTTLRNFKETSSTQISLIDDHNRNETNSDTLLIITEDETTNQSNQDLLLTNVTSEEEIILSTTYRNIKETSSTSISPTNQSTKNLLLTSVTPESEIIKSTTYQNFQETFSTPFSTTGDHNSKETNSSTILLITEDSSEKILLLSISPEGESTPFTPYQNFTESTVNSLFSTTGDGRVDFKQTTSTTPSSITEDETIKSSSENNELASLITEDESVKSTANEHSTKTTSSTRFSVTDETITPTSEKISVESLSTESRNINSTEDQDNQRENFNNFASLSTTGQLPTTESLNSNNGIELSGIEITSETDLLSSINEQLKDQTTQEKLNTIASPVTSGFLIPEIESEISTLKEISTATYDDTTQLSSTPSKSDEITLNSKRNSQSTILESTATPTTLFSSHTQSPEIEIDINTSTELNTEFTSTFTPTTSISSLSPISTIESSNWFSTAPTVNTSENLQTNKPKEIESTSSSSYVTASLKNDKVTLKEKNSQSTISESTATPTTFFSSNTQSPEIETDVNTLPSSSTEFTSTSAPITPSINSLSPISIIESSNWFSTAPTLNTSENLQTNNPKEIESTSGSSYVTASSKNDEVKLNLEGKSQSTISESITTPTTLFSSNTQSPDIKTDVNTLPPPISSLSQISTIESSNWFPTAPIVNTSENLQANIPKENFESTDSSSHVTASSKNDKAALNFEKNSQSTISETPTPTTLFSSNTQSPEIERDVNTLPSSSTKFTSNSVSITPPISSLSPIFTIESSNWFSTAPTVNTSENLQTSNPKEIESTSGSSYVTASSKNDEVTLKKENSQSTISESTATPTTFFSSNTQSPDIKTDVNTLPLPISSLSPISTIESSNWFSTAPILNTSKNLQTNNPKEIESTSGSSYATASLINDEVTLNLEENSQSTNSESTATPTTLFLSNTQSPEIEKDVNTLPSSSTEFISNSASITPPISSLSPISAIESSNWFSTAPTVNTSENLQTNIPKENLQSTASSLHVTASSNTQSPEIETDDNTLPSSSTEFTSTSTSITPLISSLSAISTIESSNWFSIAPTTLNASKNLQTNIPKENLESTASSSHVTTFSKNDEENLSSTTSSNGFSQSISTIEDTVKPIDLSTTAENLFTTVIDTRLPVESSTSIDYYEYQSIIPVSDITNSVNALLPAEVISENTPENSQQMSTSLELLESKEYSTETSSTGYSSTTQTTIFIESAHSDNDDYSTEAFTTELHQYDKTTKSSEYTLEDTESSLTAEQIDSDQYINGSPQASVELEISTIAIRPNWDVTDETSTSETFTSNEYLEEPEDGPSSQGTYFGMAEHCVCTGKKRYRNSCKKYYHCSKIGSLNRFIRSEIMECASCFQFNAKKKICDFPENVPECAVDDGSLNRICTAEGNYSIPLERNCRKYYECKRNWRGVIALQVKICQAGRIFSERLQKCVRGCRCRNAQQLHGRCEYKNAVLPDRFDCSKYHICNNEMEMKTLQCSDQYVFDGERCEYKSEVICDPSKVYRYLSDDDDCNP